MKKILLSFFTAISFLLTGCLETIQEITLNEDGSGVISNTNDMGALIGMAKQMGGAAEMEKAGDQKIDTTFSLAEGIDSIPNLSPEEKQLAGKGTLKINMDLKEEKFSTCLFFPFNRPSEIEQLTKLSGKILSETMKGQMGGESPAGLAEMPEPNSFDNYYNLNFTNGVLIKELNKEKYALAESDEYLAGMKQAGAMGMTMKSSLIINLPRPAKEVEGKAVKLSEDKMKVTIAVDINDFFSDPSLLEFKIKY